MPHRPELGIVEEERRGRRVDHDAPRDLSGFHRHLPDGKRTPGTPYNERQSRMKTALMLHPAQDGPAEVGHSVLRRPVLEPNVLMALPGLYAACFSEVQASQRLR
jgi:hypothetical protein